MNGNTFLRQVAKNIKDVRARRGLTQEEMEHLSGLMRRHYQSIEAGAINLTLLTLVRIAKALRVSPQRLLE